MATTTPDVAAVHAAADLFLGRLQRAVFAALRALQDSMEVAAAEALIGRGLSGQIVNTIPWDSILTPPTAKALGDDLQRVFADVMVAASTAAGLEVGAFTVVNPKAVQVARTQASGLVTDLRATSQRSVRRIVAQAMRGGYTTGQAARLISRTIGLDEVSANALVNFATAADKVAAGTSPPSVLRRANIRTPGPYTDLDKLTERYARQLLRGRAELIARTEVMFSANRGLRLNWENAADLGHIDRFTARYQWIVAFDDRLCPLCADMDGQIVGMTDPTGFVSSTKGGEPLPTPTTHREPPLHPKCRCSMLLLTD